VVDLLMKQREEKSSQPYRDVTHKASSLVITESLGASVHVSENGICMTMKIAQRGWKVTERIEINYPSLSMVILHE
jgi:hypothetical protein